MKCHTSAPPPETAKVAWKSSTVPLTASPMNWLMGKLSLQTGAPSAVSVVVSMLWVQAWNWVAPCSVHTTRTASADQGPSATCSRGRLGRAMVRSLQAPPV